MVRCAMWIGSIHRSLGDVTRDALVPKVEGRHAWTVPAGDAATLIDPWIHSIADHADAARTGG